MGIRSGALLALCAGAATVMAPAHAAAAPDHFADAVVLAMGDTWTGTTDGATVEAGEPTPSCAPAGATVWFTTTVVREGALVVSTAGSKIDTVVAVYTGASLATLTEVACNDDDLARDSMHARAQAHARPGTTYWVQVGGYRGAQGAVQVQTALHEPVNDDFVLRRTIDAVPYTDVHDERDAGREAGEAIPSCASDDRSVWYSLVAPQTEVLVFDTVVTGSQPYTHLAAYTGDDLAHLTEVACAGPSQGSPGAVLRLPVHAGTTYQIRAGMFGFTSRTTVAFHVRRPPANDDAAAATPVTTLPYISEASNVGATLEAGEPTACPLLSLGAYESTLWYRVAVDSPVVVRARAVSRAFDPVVAVWRAGVTMGCNDIGTGANEVVFAAIPGDSYLVQIGGFAGGLGDVTVQIAAAS